MTTFSDWLETELHTRDWRPADLARRAGLSRSTISNVLNDVRSPGAGACQSIAKALNLPAEDVLRVAGLLPSLPGFDDKLISELVTIAKNLNARERAELLEYARWRYQRQGIEYPSGAQSAGKYLQEPEADYKTGEE